MLKRSPNLLAAIGGFLALLVTHFAWLRNVGGWHFDEAWAANYAYRIAHEPGFWPLGAMTAYTWAWSHYVAAAFFKIFGASVFVHRASGLTLTVAGVALISGALHRVGEKKAAAWFPLIVAFFPTLVMNHRWVIEENSFFVLCAGMIALGLAERVRRGPWIPAYALIASGILLGVTSHTVFFGSALALWVCLFATGRLHRPADRIVSALIACSFLPFFLYVLRKEPEFRNKSLQLVWVGLALIQFHLLPEKVLSWRFRKWALAVFAAISCIALVPFAVFGEGSWLALFANGTLQTTALIGTILIPLTLAAVFAWREKLRLPNWALLAFLPISLFIITVMVGKPGPRYYEIPYLTLAALFAWTLGRLSARHSAIVATLWVTLGALQLGINYFPISLAERQVPRAYHFLRFHDASYDNL
ncbi:MAG: hypothetical protein ACXVBW_13365, partial [Bdellovibrionota bacterium]